MYSDFEPTKMDHLVCGASSAAPHAYTVSSYGAFLTVINSNMEIHWSMKFNYMEESVCIFRDTTTVIHVASVSTPTDHLELNLKKITHPSGTLTSTKQYKLEISPMDLSYNSV